MKAMPRPVLENFPFSDERDLSAVLSPAGKVVSLNDCTCFRISFDVLEKILVVNLAYRSGTGGIEPYDFRLEFVGCQILGWQDDVDLPGELPAELLPEIRGNVSGLMLDDELVTLDLTNLMISFKCDRVHYIV